MCSMGVDHRSGRWCMEDHSHAEEVARRPLEDRALPPRPRADDHGRQLSGSASFNLVIFCILGSSPGSWTRAVGININIHIYMNTIFNININIFDSSMY